MTIIAYRDRIMAADKQTTYAGHAMTTTKLRKFANGALAGASGNSGMCRQLMDWIADGMLPEEFPDKDATCDVLLVRPDGKIYLVMEGNPAPVEIEEPFAAIGSGRDFAIGAMDRGAKAIEAVITASRYNVSCGRGVDALELGDAAA